MTDESGESIKRKCQSSEQTSWNLGDWYQVDEEKLGVDSRDKVKHIENNDLLFAEMTLVGEPV